MQQVAECESDLSKRHSQVLIGLIGFFLSVFFIFWGLLVLVRFWIFSNILYNIFILSMLIAGILTNISSLNLLLSEECTSAYIKPFVYGKSVTIFWNIIGIILPLTHDKYYEMFSDVPFLIYSDEFYSGEAFNKSEAFEHPFVKKISPPGSSFFDHPYMVIVTLAIVLVIQIAFWAYVIRFFIKIKKEESLLNANLKTM